VAADRLDAFFVGEMTTSNLCKAASAGKLPAASSDGNDKASPARAMVTSPKGTSRSEPWACGRNGRSCRQAICKFTDANAALKQQASFFSDDPRFGAKHNEVSALLQILPIAFNDLLAHAPTPE
jgi:hypothetical protein